MRDPERIWVFCTMLASYWEANCVDLRFGQLVESLFLYIRSKGKDPFYLEEAEMQNYIKEFFESKKEIKW